MSLLPLFSWLGASWAGRFMQSATWGFASVEIVHLFGLALLGGAVLILGLRVFGVILRGEPIAILARGLAPVLIGGLITLIASGILLVADGPLRYYANIAFRVKIVLLLAAILFSLYLYRSLARGSDAPRSLRVATLFSALLWLGVGLAGRAIGLL
jgi:hypothetical protein